MIEVIPAIDIIDGRCVRLYQGDYGKATVYGELPADMARRLCDAGATTLHLVDLDGAKASCPRNLRVLSDITSSTALRVEWGGGIKSDDSIKAVLDAGADRAVCGSVAVTDPELINGWLSLYGGGKVSLGADVRHGKVSTHGWLKDSEVTAEDLIGRFIPSGLTQAVCTEISRDGTLLGPSWPLYERLQRQFPELCITVSGGVASVADIERAAGLGLPRIIVGKALYEGRITIQDLQTWWRKG